MRKGTDIKSSIERLTYSAAGVDTEAGEQGLKALLKWVNKTQSFRKDIGKPQIDIGYYANVIDVGHGLGIAISTDGVGSKIIIAHMLEKYDTLGIDCIAMNVNDVLCVGAEPLALVDCVSVEEPSPTLLEQIGKGLYEGAKQAHISIVGGEIAQVKDMIRSYGPGMGFELSGTCIGTVQLDQIILGDSIKDGDVLIGFRSSGVHSNGLSLARKALFERGEYRVDDSIAELGCTLGEELLRPTQIYVDEVMALREKGITVKALAHITSDGFLNLTRVRPDIGYIVEAFPQPQPIFDIIQKTGNVSDEEMFRVFNMGIGFSVVIDPSDVDATLEILKGLGTEAYYLGYTVTDPERQVWIKPYDLVGRNGRFFKASDL